MSDQEKINKITEAFEEDAKRSNAPRKESSPNIHKRIHEEDATKSYSGEASPYWDRMAESGDLRNKDSKVQEDVLANPDVLSEEDAIHNRPLTPQGETMMRAVREVFAELSGQQSSILQLSYDGVWSDEAGERLYTEQAIADELKITRDNVHKALSRIKTKVRQRYERLKASGE